MLHIKWHIFSQLYTDQETVNLLDESAPTFFGVCYLVLLNDVILEISRLTDPSKTGKHENLTIERMVEATNSLVCDHQAELDELLSLIRCKCKFARTIRNRRLAHTDLEACKHPEILPAIEIGEVEEALLALRNIMNQVASYFDWSEELYELSSFGDDANTLIGCLEEARSYRDRC
jgi:hypothetical protein